MHCNSLCKFLLKKIKTLKPNNNESNSFPGDRGHGHHATHIAMGGMTTLSPPLSSISRLLLHLDIFLPQ
jgi:hypothetical protein